MRRVGYNERDGCARMLREMATSMYGSRTREIGTYPSAHSGNGCRGIPALSLCQVLTLLPLPSLGAHFDLIHNSNSDRHQAGHWSALLGYLHFSCLDRRIHSPLIFTLYRSAPHGPSHNKPYEGGRLTEYSRAMNTSPTCVRRSVFYTKFLADGKP